MPIRFTFSHYYLRYALPCLLALLLSRCATQEPYYRQSVEAWEQKPAPSKAQRQHSVFLFGDAGAYPQNNAALHAKLRQDVLAAGEASTILFLGDNAYPRGLPDSATEGYAAAKTVLDALLGIIEGYPGRAVFLPGNHDWAQGNAEGWQNVQNQEAYVERQSGRPNLFRPSGGCPGPEVIKLGHETVLILFDSQWWLHPGEKPQGDDSPCEIKTRQDFLVAMHDAVIAHPEKRIIVAGHHPLLSRGPHGGKYPIKTHLFPLTEFWDGGYVPLPGIGSIYVIGRGVFGNIQDIPNPTYQELKRGLLTVFAQHEDLVYVSGHDHSMQYFDQDSLHVIVSGSGAKTTHVLPRGESEFAYSHTGYTRIDYYTDGTAWVSFFTADREGPVFRHRLFASPPDSTSDRAAILPDYADSSITLAASPRYARSKLGKFIGGSNRRSVWTEPITVPVFGLNTWYDKRLRFTEVGGGMQTRSIEVEDEQDRRYDLRSIDKSSEKLVPEELHGTVFQDIVQDQFSANHPYGALIVPPLADAAGVYHTNPQVVYLPDDPRLGPHREELGGMMMLLEEHPDEEHKDVPGFPKSEDIIPTEDVLKEIQDDNDHLIEQELVLRSRLFDFVLGDWDRHEGQWSWALTEYDAPVSNDPDKENFFQPIPEDRDEVMFYGDGLFLNMLRPFIPFIKFQNFKAEMPNLKGLGYNARHFDRTFLTEPSEAAWLRIAEDLQARLSDSVIERAVHELPPEISAIHGDTAIAKLKARRELLPQMAREYYHLLAKQVDVRGSNDRESFQVRRQADGTTEVSVWKIGKKTGRREHRMYHRVFRPGETKEIRLYALDGNDSIRIRGEGQSGIQLRIVGGPGEDVIVDESTVKGLACKTHVYDTRTGNHLQLGSESRDRTSRYQRVNRYERKAFNYDNAIPSLGLGFNPDDGLMLGAGGTLTTFGFRKKPFASQHSLSVLLSLQTEAAQVDYQGRYTDVLGLWDVQTSVHYQTPTYAVNFFGFGNNTRLDDDLDREFYWVRNERFRFEPALIQNVGEKHELQLRPAFHFTRVDRFSGEEPRLIDFPEQLGLDPNTIFERQFFASAGLGYAYDTRDNPYYPRHGVHFELAGDLNFGLNEEAEDYQKFSAAFSTYQTWKWLTYWTLAVRVGAEVTGGDDFTFWQGAHLGGMENLRGFRKTRFTGRHSAYNNLELRFPVAKFFTPLAPMRFGLLALNDIGRVWVNGEGSERWHHGAGYGIWFAAADAIVLSASHSFSTEDNVIFAQLGMKF